MSASWVLEGGIMVLVLLSCIILAVLLLKLSMLKPVKVIFLAHTFHQTMLYVKSCVTKFILVT
jgi:hypothetical protein